MIASDARLLFRSEIDVAAMLLNQSNSASFFAESIFVTALAALSAESSGTLMRHDSSRESSRGLRTGITQRCHFGIWLDIGSGYMRMNCRISRE
jgi:hypothetical protein